MRTIKFRAWHLDDGMLYFDFDTFQKDYHDQYGNIMQFTGLYDKNGKEIYEGDVDQYGRVCTYYRGSFIMEHKINPSYAYLGDCEHIEIIGNLYENPELL